jgi:hypothetical protein
MPLLTETGSARWHRVFRWTGDAHREPKRMPNHSRRIAGATCLPGGRWRSGLVPVTAGLRQRCPPTEVGHAGRAERCERAQAAPRVKDSNSYDRREDDRTENVDHRRLLLIAHWLLASSLGSVGDRTAPEPRPEMGHRDRKLHRPARPSDVLIAFRVGPTYRYSAPSRECGRGRTRRVPPIRSRPAR